MVNNYWTIVRISMLQATSTCASAVDIFFLKINRGDSPQGYIVIARNFRLKLEKLQTCRLILLWVNHSKVRYSAYASSRSANTCRPSRSVTVLFDLHLRLSMR